MTKAFLAAVALGAATFTFGGSASAMPIDVGASTGSSGATQVAWYCNRNGRHCVRAPRRGYVVRNNCNWNGRYCAPFAVGPRVVAPRAFVPAPRVVVKPNRGKVVIRP